jgi:predicted RNase H-like nuclease (RuvC/YqgF family)
MQLVPNNPRNEEIEMTQSIQSAYDAITKLNHEMNMKDHLISQLHDEIARLNGIIEMQQAELANSQSVAYVRYIEDDYRAIGRESDLKDHIIRDKSNTIRIKDETIAQLRMENRSFKSEIGSLNRTVEMQRREIAQLKTESIDNFESCIIDPAMFDTIPGFTGFASCGNGCAVVKMEGKGFEDMHDDTCPESEEYDLTLLEL